MSVFPQFLPPGKCPNEFLVSSHFSSSFIIGQLAYGPWRPLHWALVGARAVYPEVKGGIISHSYLFWKG